MSDENLKGRYLDAQQVAVKYRISIKTVYHYRKTGFLPGFKLGSRVLFDKEELEARIEEIKEETRKKQKKNSET